MTITKQRVEEIISRIEMYGHGAGYTVDEVYDLAVLALNLSNIANLKRYELDIDGCDSFGQDCGADMTEDSDGDYVLFDDVVKLFEFGTTTKKLEPPATDAFLAEVKTEARKEGAYFVANRMLAAWEAGFIDDTAKNAADIARMILTSTEFMDNAPEGDFDRSFSDGVLEDIAAQLRKGVQS